MKYNQNERIDERIIKIRNLNGTLTTSNIYEISPKDGNLIVDYVYEDKKNSYPIEFGNQHISLSNLKQLIGLKWIELIVFNTDDECSTCNCNGCSCNGCDGDCDDCEYTPCKSCDDCKSCIYSYNFAVRIRTNEAFQTHAFTESELIKKLISPLSLATWEDYEKYKKGCEPYQYYIDLFLLYSDDVNSNCLLDLACSRNSLSMVMNSRKDAAQVDKINIKISYCGIHACYLISQSSVKAVSDGAFFWKTHLKISFETYDYAQDKFVELSQEFPLDDRKKEIVVTNLLNTRQIKALHLRAEGNDKWICSYV